MTFIDTVNIQTHRIRITWSGTESGCEQLRCWYFCGEWDPSRQTQRQ